MKLLFDQNLSFKLCALLSDPFPDSAQVRQLGLDRADDRAIWQFARGNQFTLVTQDSDFADLAAIEGPPPKVILLRCGNQSVAAIHLLLRERIEAIKSFDADSGAACLEIY